MNKKIKKNENRPLTKQQIKELMVLLKKHEWDGRWVDPSCVILPVEYQRIEFFDEAGHMIQKFNTRQKQIGEGFNPLKFKVPIICERQNKSLYAIDGAHRIRAASYIGLPKIKCAVFSGLTLKEEAEIFESQREGKNVEPMTLYKSGLTSEHADCFSVMRVLSSFQMHAQTALHNSGDIACVGTLRLIVRRYGEDVLKSTLQLIQDTWGFDHPEPKSGQWLLSIAEFFVIPAKNGVIDLDHLKKSWRMVAPITIQQHSKRIIVVEGVNARRAIARVLETIATKRRRRGTDHPSPYIDSVPRIV